jgi:hypothetical protein
METLFYSLKDLKKMDRFESMKTSIEMKHRKPDSCIKKALYPYLKIP